MIESFRQLAVQSTGQHSQAQGLLMAGNLCINRFRHLRAYLIISRAIMAGRQQITQGDALRFGNSSIEYRLGFLNFLNLHQVVRYHDLFRLVVMGVRVGILLLKERVKPLGRRRRAFITVFMQIVGIGTAQLHCGALQGKICGILFRKRHGTLRKIQSEYAAVCREVAVNHHT